MHLQSLKKAQFRGMPWQIRPCDTWSPQPSSKYCTNCINIHLLKYVITYPWVTLCFQKPPSGSKAPLNTNVSLSPSPLKTSWKCLHDVPVWYLLWHGISSDITHSYSSNKFKSPHNSVYNNANFFKPRRMFHITANSFLILTIRLITSTWPKLQDTISLRSY